MQVRRDRIYARFEQLLRSHLRAPPREAVSIAGNIRDSWDRLNSFCLDPEARPDSISAAILTRWFEAIPGVLPAAVFLSNRAIAPVTLLALSDDRLALIHQTANSIALGQFDLHPLDASEFANCVERAARPAFTFDQYCVEPHRRPLKTLASALNSYVRDACLHGAAAMSLIERRRVAV
jgi:hypothetical protein